MTLRALQCFAAGLHTSSDGRIAKYSETDLMQMANSYDPHKRSAPLVLGHPDSDAPAYGEARALIAVGPSLFCIADVSDGLQALVRNGNYKNISASFFQPDSPANPAKGSHYLKHVGFLGAVQPAVKGMQPLAFAADIFDAEQESRDSVDFAAPRGSYAEDQRQQLHRVAKDLQRATGSSFIDAAIRAERALLRR